MPTNFLTDRYRNGLNHLRKEYSDSKNPNKYIINCQAYLDENYERSPLLKERVIQERGSWLRGAKWKDPF